MKSLHINLTEFDHKKLKEISKKEKRSLGFLARRAIRNFLTIKKAIGPDEKE